MTAGPGAPPIATGRPRRQVGSSGRRAAAVSLVGLLVALAGCSDDDGAAARRTTTTAEAPSATERPAPSGGAVVELGPDDDLYALAEDLAPGAPGQPIAVQPVETGLEASVWRVLYHSRSVAGDDIAVSGLVAVPPGPAPDGGRPMLSWAHGTTGIADECAPSRAADDPALLLAGPLLQRGLVVVATDYEGLGTPGRHPYLVGESEGRAVLDIARAARGLGERVGASAEVVVWGHSQGGHAALFANEIAAEWAPELDVLGAVAGAPVSQLPALAGQGGQGPFGVFTAMLLAGWEAAYPDVEPSEVLTPEGEERMALVDEGCVREVAASWGEGPAAELVRPGVSLEDLSWAERFAENDPGHRIGAAPLLVIHGDADELIPVRASVRLVEGLCELGATVELRRYADESHGGVVLASLADVLQWVDQRLAGEPAAAVCP